MSGDRTLSAPAIEAPPVQGYQIVVAVRGAGGTLNPMNLRLHTDYALRVLLYLAHADAQVSVEAMARGYGISKEHLFKVVQQLARLGYVTTRGGRGGGVRLARRAADINVGAVVAEFEGRSGVLACVADPGVCVLEPGCVLRGALIKAENAFYDTLSKLTIADAIQPNAARQSGGVYNLTIRRAAPAPASSLGLAQRAAFPTARAAEGQAD
jgi:Rrf2 family transcriptional regulator, nitric oxide-sensitive transcriptional repressor